MVKLSPNCSSTCYNVWTGIQRQFGLAHITSLVFGASHLGAVRQDSFGRLVQASGTQAWTNWMPRWDFNWDFFIALCFIRIAYFKNWFLQWQLKMKMMSVYLINLMKNWMIKKEITRVNFLKKFCKFLFFRM